MYGVSGSGKSTLAGRIGARLGLPYHAIDDLTWEPGWVPVNLPEQRVRVAAICAGEAWVIDAGYAAWLDVALARTDLIVGLDLPRWRSLGRLARRTVRRIRHGTPTCNGNYETWRNSVLTRELLLLLHFRSYKRKQQRMHRWHADPAAPPTVLLHTPAEVERWLADLPISGRL